MRITLNLATRPFADQGPAIRKLRVAMGVLALAAIGLGVGLHMVDKEAAEARARDAALNTKISHVEQERQGYKTMMQQPANAAVLQQAQYLNQLFDEKAFSWTLAMEDLETVLPGGVQVTTLEPNREKDGHILLRLRVLGPRDKAVDLVKNLEHSKHFLEPQIVGESAENTSGPQQAAQPVSAATRENFDLEAEYNPASAAERAQAKKKASAETKSDKHARNEDNAETTKPAGVHARAPYTGMSRPKAPTIPHRGVAR